MPINKVTIIAVVLLIGGSSALGQHSHREPATINTSQDTATGGSVSRSGNSSNTVSNGSSSSVGVGVYGGETSVTTGPTNVTTGPTSNSNTTGASNSSTAVSTSTSSTYNQVRQAPPAYAPDALPSAPCRISGSAGVSSPVGGLSIGGSTLDAECDRRETARAFALLGNRMAAARILCNTKAAKEAQLTYQECANYAEGYFHTR